MTKIKLCGLSRLEDIQAANRLRPDYVGFVFASKSCRYVTPTQAKALKEVLDEGIQAVGVFVDAPVEQVASLLNRGVIDVAQLHGHEEDGYIQILRQQTERPICRRSGGSRGRPGTCPDQRGGLHPAGLRRGDGEGVRLGPASVYPPPLFSGRRTGRGPTSPTPSGRRTRMGWTSARASSRTGEKIERKWRSLWLR